MSENQSLELIHSRSFESVVRMTGSINTVLTASISETTSKQRTPFQTGYSFGLGAFGQNFQVNKYRYGEFCSTPFFSGILTGGEKTETVCKTGSGTLFYTPFNVSIGSEFQEVIRLNLSKTITFSGLYDLLFERGRTKPFYKGIVTVVSIFKIDGFFGSLIRTSPLEGSIPDGKIIDQKRYGQWFGIDTTPVYNGHLALSVGLGLDLNYNRYSEDKIQRIFYLHPGNKNAVEKMLHNHCFILPKGAIPLKAVGLNPLATGMLNENSVLDVKHILDNSTISEALLGVSYAQEITDLT